MSLHHPFPPYKCWPLGTTVSPSKKPTIISPLITLQRNIYLNLSLTSKSWPRRSTTTTCSTTTRRRRAPARSTTRRRRSTTSTWSSSAALVPLPPAHTLCMRSTRPRRTPRTSTATGSRRRWPPSPPWAPLATPSTSATRRRTPRSTATTETMFARSILSPLLDSSLSIRVRQVLIWTDICT